MHVLPVGFPKIWQEFFEGGFLLGVSNVTTFNVGNVLTQRRSGGLDT